MIKKLVTLSAFVFVFTSLSFAGHHATDEMKKADKTVKETKETALQAKEKEAKKAKEKLEKKMEKAEAKKEDIKKKIK